MTFPLSCQGCKMLHEEPVSVEASNGNWVDSEEVDSRAQFCKDWDGKCKCWASR